MITVLLVSLQVSTAPTPVSPTTAVQPEKRICRSSADTGSFVRKTKTCRTRAEWRRIEDNAQETGRGLQQSLSGERGG